MSDAAGAALNKLCRFDTAARSTNPSHAVWEGCRFAHAQTDRLEGQQVGIDG
jgi:hypothetical protein